MPETRAVNCELEEFDSYCGRGSPRLGLAPSIFGNPFVIGRDGDRRRVIEKFEVWFYRRCALEPDYRAEAEKLEGKRLGCHCKPWND